MCWKNGTLAETLVGSKEREATKEKVLSLTPSPVDQDPHYSGSSPQWNTHYNKRNKTTSGSAARNKRRNSTSRLTIIDGDSILKHLQGHNLSRPHSKVQVFLAAPQLTWLITSGLL